MKYLSFLIFICLLQFNIQGQNLPQDISAAFEKCLKGGNDVYKENFGEILEIPVTRGGTPVPKLFSLKEFVPEVVQQEGPSCASYATAYYGFSTYKRFSKKNNKLEPFDPLYLYGRKHSFYILDSTIDIGWSCEIALTFLRDFGNPSKTPPYRRSNENPLKEFPEKLNSFKALNNSYKQIDKIKYSICMGSPVVVAMSTNLSLESYKFQRIKKYIDSTNFNQYKEAIISDMLTKDENYSIKELEFEFNKLLSTDEYCWSGKLPKNGEGLHGMCIIGYDDEKFGGAFEIVNSWDKHWANNGFIWIKYADLYKMYPSFYKIGN